MDVGQDITAATGTFLDIKKPDGTTSQKVASIVDTNYLQYTTVAGDIDQAGVYRIQAVLTLGGWSGLGETAELMVYDIYN